jgi:UDP-N-acetylmuramyl tripeptide synthase
MGAGATWRGEVALWLNPHILSELARNLKKGVIIVAGTNGKTTSSLMIQTIVENNELTVVSNASGANLENGIVSALINNSHADYGVFEIDENSLPVVLKSVQPKIIVLLNLFRDQLDRYGEVDVIAEKWEKALEDTKATIIANADDPLIAHLGQQHKTLFFGIEDKTKYQKTAEHATDSTFCLNCGGRLQYDGVFFSHMGIWKCPACAERRPKPDVIEALSPIAGLYNTYNALAAASVAKVLKITADLTGFHPAFGRQEQIGNTKIFLSKNPAGFNQSLRTALELGAKEMLLVLNDRVPDGRDVSWIWDVDFEMIPKSVSVRVSGDRVYDLALRLKYAGINAKIFENLGKALRTTNQLFVLPTYSAMLDVRNLILGNKIPLTTKTRPRKSCQ